LSFTDTITPVVELRQKQWGGRGRGQHRGAKSTATSTPCITVFPLKEAGSQIQAGSLIEAGGSDTIVLIEAGGFY